jgi:hypothetical protein
MKEHDQDKISSQYSNIFYRLDQENMLKEIVNHGYEVTTYSIEVIAISTGEYSGYQSHMALFPLL